MSQQEAARAARLQFGVNPGAVGTITAMSTRRTSFPPEPSSTGILPRLPQLPPGPAVRADDHRHHRQQLGLEQCGVHSLQCRLFAPHRCARSLFAVRLRLGRSHRQGNSGDLAAAGRVAATATRSCRDYGDAPTTHADGRPVRGRNSGRWRVLSNARRERCPRAHATRPATNSGAEFDPGSGPGSTHGDGTLRFSGAADILGRKVLIRGHPFVVVGVMPDGFTGLAHSLPDLWAPLTTLPDFEDIPDAFAPDAPAPVGLAGRAEEPVASRGAGPGQRSAWMQRFRHARLRPRDSSRSLGRPGDPAASARRAPLSPARRHRLLPRSCSAPAPMSPI